MQKKKLFIDYYMTFSGFGITHRLISDGGCYKTDRCMYTHTHIYSVFLLNSKVKCFYHCLICYLIKGKVNQMYHYPLMESINHSKQ